MAMTGKGGYKPPMAMGGKGSGAVSNYGGDKSAYLGHFRSAENMARGHNQGAPNLMGTSAAPPRLPETATTAAAPPTGRVKPTFDPTTNPIAATRQQNRANLSAAKLAGGGALKAARGQAKANLAEAKGVRKERNAAGLGAADRGTLKAARGEARAVNQAGAQSARMAKQAATKTARANLQQSTAGVRSARQALRGAIRGGNVGGVSTDFANLQSAKGARKSARSSLKATRGGGLGSLI